MPTNSSTSLKNSIGKRNPFVEVSDAEKQLWARIHSKGVLDNDAKDLYRKACSLYEMLFLSDNELPDLQHIEYLLWRLHYKHIDEFRKRISHNSVEEDDNKQPTNGPKMEGFKTFLSEASKFYQDLIRKIKRYYGLLEEPWFYKNDGESGRIEQSKLHKCQFVCHRLCVCLGDLARYLESFGKPEDEQRSWSVAASYYLEAAKIYPDSGNPHNQLAVLAMYIGDEFLALYHCIRSLAVKEPFPDALQNLMLLFERNRSINIDSLSNEVYDSCNPSEWLSSPSKQLANGNFSNNNTKAHDGDQSLASDLWSLIIRTTSFFFLESSLDSFDCTFTSTLRELEALLSLDVAKLSSALESYHNLNLSKAGPYRALHTISILLFAIHNLSDEPADCMILKPSEANQPVLSNLALTSTFVFMGRLVDRCLKGGPVIYFPLLPAVLVFVEWLVGAVENLHIVDEKCQVAKSYFFSSFVQLLNRLLEVIARDRVKFRDRIALWEDYELRGFMPLLHTHSSLDFSTRWEEEINYKMKNEYRAYRIIQAAMKIAEKRGGPKWVSYAEEENKFIFNKNVDAKPNAIVEEEEDIVFKPITRHNSEPIALKGNTKPPSSSSSSSSSSSNNTSDESLRRASSVLAAQNRALISSFGPHIANKNSPGSSSPGPIRAGPPSLSSWVLNANDGLSSGAQEKGRVLKPIDEMMTASNDLGTLSLTKDEKPGIGMVAPSAPPLLLPGFPPPNTLLSQEPAGFFPQVPGLSFPANPNLMDLGPPEPNIPWRGPGRGQFPKLGNYSFQRAHQNGQPNGSGGGSRFDGLDAWRGGPPLLHPGSPLLRGLYGPGPGPVPSPYAGPPMPVLAQRPEYLKQQDWQFQPHGPQFTGSPYYMQQN